MHVNTVGVSSFRSEGRREGLQAFSIISWNVNYDPGSRTETTRLRGEKRGKYKAAVACVRADTGAEAEAGGAKRANGGYDLSESVK